MTIFVLFLSLFLPRPAAAASTGTLTVCDDVQDPMTLDPQKQFTAKNHTLLQQVYEGLVRFDPDGRVVPALAESWERIDPLRMRFKLRRGVHFHDGEPFDSRAVVFSISRYIDPATSFPALGFISSIEKAEAVDSYTVDIVTRFSDGLLLNRLAGFIVITAPDFIRDNGEKALQVRSAGTGPFILDQWQRGEFVSLIRNRHYWNPGHPKMDRLVFKFIPLDQQVPALLRGDVDLLTDLPGTETTRLRQNGFQVIKMPSFYTYGASFNISRPPLSDPRVRQALNYAVNRNELIRYDALGNGIALATLTMAGESGHNEELKPYPFDLKKARALLRKAGYPHGIALKACVKVQSARTFRVLKSMLSRIGVTISETISPDADMLEQSKKGGWDMIYGDCPDPMAQIYFIQAIFLYSRSPFSIMKDPEYDRLLERMASTLDSDERERAATDLDRYVYENALSLFTYQRIRTYGLGKTIRFKPWITGMPYFDDATRTE